jgi:hypothetical protein
MHSGANPQQPKKELKKWYSLSPEEKKRQFKELVQSTYWNYLPDEIQRRIQEIVSN